MRYALPVYMLCAALFTALYFQTPLNAPGISLENLTAFRGATPYQYRVLAPILARGAQAVLPLPLLSIYIALTFAFALGLFVAWRAYLQPYFGEAAAAYAVLLLYSLLWNYTIAGSIRYPWDIPAIFFFVLGVALIQRERWHLYYLVFFLACLNRETSCFLILAFVLLNWRRRRWQWLLGHVAAQAAIWLGVKVVLTRLFLHNPGEKVFENKLVSNLSFMQDALLRPQESWDWMLLTFGWMAILIVLGWRTLPTDLKRLLLIVPPFLCGMALVGDFGQMRIHNELVPLLLAPALWSIKQGMERGTRHWRRASGEEVVRSKAENDHP